MQAATPTRKPKAARPAPLSPEAAQATSDLLRRLSDLIAERVYSPRIKLLTKAHVSEATGYGESTIDEMVAEDRFPKPITATRRPMWRESTLIAWMDAQEGR